MVDTVTDTTDSALSETENRHHRKWKRMHKYNGYIQKTDLHWLTNFNDYMIVWFHDFMI